MSNSGKRKTITFTNKIADDATPAVLKFILDNGIENISEIKFEKGIYHFYSDKALEQFVYMSNHDDVLVRTAFPLKNANNLTVDANNATFIFHGRMIPFLVEESEEVMIKNVTVDWEVPFHSEGLVVARNEKNKTFDLKISENFPYVIRDKQLVFIKDGYEHTVGEGILYNPERSAIAYNTEAYTPLWAFKRTAYENGTNLIKHKYEIDPRDPIYHHKLFEYCLEVEPLKPGLVRIHNHGKLMPNVGMIFACKGEHGKNRIAPAFRVTHTKNFNALNVTVHHAGGMGLIAENSHNLCLDNFNVTPSNGRMVSTTADATHFVGCSGKVILKNCTFQNQLDDASNIHGTYQKVVDVLDDYTLGVRMGHFQQLGFVIAQAQDTIGLVRLSESFFPYKKLTVKKLEQLNKRYQIITFNEKLPKQIKAGDLIENLQGYPELLVQNCVITNNRARGLLISTPKKAVIENNIFSTEMSAILVPVESGHWYESGSATDLTIRNNEFKDCSFSGYDQAVISFVTDDDNQNIAFKNIEISNNTFNTFDNLILDISNTDGFKFSGNKISTSGTWPKINPQNPAIRIKTSKNIVFEENEYRGTADNILETDKQSSPIKFK
ncbi:right-handed parallel beta-helix repeat-containing protein [Saccharicrinis aurantiacus]|uniref:right-handed parallel beta-helix repeat-containing protein n=1 Tax=Saccharicrinis aurantiacus TaxID=1849719 RepID=UPI000B331F5D|nr:hypothetical protein [Saccharicrinis aurantiacus]